MKYPILTFILLQLSLFVQAGNPRIDSLLNELVTIENDTVELELLYQLAWDYRRIDPRKTIEFASRLYDKASELENDRELARAFNLQGIGNSILGENAKAIEWFEKAIEAAEKTDDLSVQMGPINNIGRFYMNHGKFLEALPYFQQAAQIAKELNKMDSWCIFTMNIGLVMESQKDLQKAEEYYVQALEGARKSRNFTSQADILNLLSDLYIQKNPIVSLDFTKQALKISEQTGDSVGIQRNMQVLGQIHYQLKEYQEALKYFDKARAISEARGFTSDHTRSILLSANVNFVLGNNEQALKLTDELNLIASEKNLLPYLKEVYRLYAGINERQGNFENAYLYQKEYQLLQDSLAAQERSTAISELEIKYNTEQREMAYNLLKADQAQKEAAIQRSKSISLLIFVVLLLVGTMATFLYFAYSHKKRNNKLLEQKVEERTKELLTSNHTLQQANQELERFNYIASHDLKEPLRNINSFIGLLDRSLGNKVTQEQSDFLNFIRNNASQMNYLITSVLEFSSAGKDKFSKHPVHVEALLNKLIANMYDQLSKRNATVSLSGKFPTMMAHEPHLELVFKHLIDNGLKFNRSDAPHIKIYCKKNEDHYLFTVEDNGIGISEEFFGKIFDMFGRLHDRESFKGSGLGLAICKKIISQNFGELWVESAESQGSRFSFSWPTLSFKKEPSVNKTINQSS